MGPFCFLFFSLLWLFSVGLFARFWGACFPPRKSGTRPSLRGVCCGVAEFPVTTFERRGPASNWMARANEDPSSLLRKRTCNYREAECIASRKPTRDSSIVLEGLAPSLGSCVITPTWGKLGCTHRVTPGRFAGQFDLNVPIIVQRNFTFKQERGFTKRKTATRS